MDKIWCVDLPDLQLISRYDKEILFYIFDVFSKYTWLLP